MGSRSRKRIRSADDAAAVPATARAAQDAAPAAAPADPPASADPRPLDDFSAIAPPAPPAKKLRGAAADDAVRARLKPLEPGERPPALLAAIGLALVLGVANLVLALVDFHVHDKTTSQSGGIVFAVVMFGAAWGMWKLRYWAILGFQTLLALTTVAASLGLIVASNVWAVLLCLTVIGLFGWLFWKLVRVLSRVQMPGRPVH